MSVRRTHEVMDDHVRPTGHRGSLDTETVSRNTRWCRFRRVSVVALTRIRDQNADSQRGRAVAAGVAKAFVGGASSMLGPWSQLEAARRHLHEGDVLVAYRLGRSVTHAAEVAGHRGELVIGAHGAKDGYDACGAGHAPGSARQILP